jgi:hypothetical protein
LRGLSQEALACYPTTILEAARPDSTVCAICLEGFAKGDSVKYLRCFDCFHSKCADAWLGRVSSCPLCKLAQ